MVSGNCRSCRTGGTGTNTASRFNMLFHDHIKTYPAIVELFHHRQEYYPGYIPFRFHREIENITVGDDHLRFIKEFHFHDIKGIIEGQSQNIKAAYKICYSAW